MMNNLINMNRRQQQQRTNNNNNNNTTTREDPFAMLSRLSSQNPLVCLMTLYPPNTPQSAELAAMVALRQRRPEPLTQREQPFTPQQILLLNEQFNITPHSYNPSTGIYEFWEDGLTVPDYYISFLILYAELFANLLPRLRGLTGVPVRGWPPGARNRLDFMSSDSDDDDDDESLDGSIGDDDDNDNDDDDEPHIDRDGNVVDTATSDSDDDNDNEEDDSDENDLDESMHDAYDMDEDDDDSDDQVSDMFEARAFQIRPRLQPYGINPVDMDDESEEHYDDVISSVHIHDDDDDDDDDEDDDESDSNSNNDDDDDDNTISRSAELVPEHHVLFGPMRARHEQNRVLRLIQEYIMAMAQQTTHVDEDTEQDDNDENTSRSSNTTANKRPRLDVKNTPALPKITFTIDPFISADWSSDKSNTSNTTGNSADSRGSRPGYPPLPRLERGRPAHTFRGSRHPTDLSISRPLSQSAEILRSTGGPPALSSAARTRFMINSSGSVGTGHSMELNQALTQRGIATLGRQPLQPTTSTSSTSSSMMSPPRRSGLFQNTNSPNRHQPPSSLQQKPPLPHSMKPNAPTNINITTANKPTCVVSFSSLILPIYYQTLTPTQHFSSYLQPGTTFLGSQGIGNNTSRYPYSSQLRRNNIDGMDEWEVSVTIHSVNYKTGVLNGEMQAVDVPSSTLPMTLNATGQLTSAFEARRVKTFWSGEIIDFRNFELWTRKWNSERSDDAMHWGLLEPFVELKKLLLDTSLSPFARNNNITKFLLDFHTKYVLMRWKEEFFINQSASNMGLTIAGFYFVVMRRRDGVVEGFYHDKHSSPYQRIVLKPTMADGGYIGGRVGSGGVSGSAGGKGSGKEKVAMKGMQFATYAFM